MPSGASAATETMPSSSYEDGKWGERSELLASFPAAQMRMVALLDRGVEGVEVGVEDLGFA